MSGQPPRALVVEDDPAWREILTEILSDDGIAVDLAADLDSAVRAMREDAHRLAVVDISLGGPDHHNQDGLGALDALRRHDPNCVLLLLTGFATVELAVRVMSEHGALTCLRKERFQRSEFRRWVGRALEIAPGAARRTAGTAAGSSDGPESSRRNENQAWVVPPPSSEAIVVEDDAGWRSLLGELLAEAGFRVTSCSSYVEALGHLKRTDFQLAVIDLSLTRPATQAPNRDGYRLLSNTHLVGIPTIVVSGYAEPSAIEQAMEKYEILVCIEKQSFDRSAFLQTVRGAAGQQAQDPAMANLTAREREVLVLLARGLTNKQIASAIRVSPNTVKRHLKSVYAKLEVSTRAAATARAVSAGLSNG